MYTIVVADDEEELRKAILRKIDWEAIGFIVVGEAENGIEALDLVEKLEPDLLLTDIRMPFISGIELARQVREVRPATQIVFLSGFDEFSYAQQAIQYNIISYLLKPISMIELTAALVEIKNKIDKIFADFTIKDHKTNDNIPFLIPLILDDTQTDFSDERESELRIMGDKYNLITEESNLNFVVMVTRIRDYEGTNCTKEEHVNAIDNILRKYVKYSSFYGDKKVVSLLMGTPASLDKYLHILAGNIVQSIERILGKQCVLGISRPTNKLVFLHDLYREAINASGYAPRDSSSVHYISDEEPQGFMDVESIENMVMDIENHIRGGSKEDLKKFLNELFSQIENAQASRVYINNLLIQILSSVCKILFAVSENEGIAENSLLQQIQFFDGSLKKNEQRITVFCIEAFDTVADNRKKSSEILCDKTVQYIKKNYANPDISLISISSEIGVSPNYLSAIVKKYTGQTFIDLLTKQRVESAKKYLISSQMKIREISEKCGYNDQHYFSYCFKKYIGQSPGALRQEYLKNKEGGTDES